MVMDSMLRDAVIRGNEEAFRRLILDGEDANSVIGALILGSPSFDELDVCSAQVSAPRRLSILSFLLENHCLSLYTLNASHSSLKGLTPLGAASYLNQLDFVTILLEKSDGLVLVDGMDSQRATPLMYAARDGHTNVLRYLIRQGARINSVDCCYRSVIFYATSAPQCLWECELNLRLQRARSLFTLGKKRKLKLTLQQDVNEYNSVACLYQHLSTYPLSSSTLQSRVKDLVISIAASDVSAVHSLLFPLQEDQSSRILAPVLVNFTDENGWSPIHYCVTAPRPSTAILDALYIAGADLSLYTADNRMAPLHALARYGGCESTASFRLHAFIVHLVRDLGAPLDAVDLQGETCIHISARYGRCADILMAFLECDIDGAVAKIKNNDGKTAYEVAKPKFRSALEQEDGSIRPGSAASLRTIKPSYSSASLTSSYSCRSSSSSDSCEDDLEQQEQFPRPVTREKEYLRTVLMDPSEAQQLLESLEYVSEKLHKAHTKWNYSACSLIKGKAKLASDPEDVQSLLQSTNQSSSELLERYRRLIDAEMDDLQAAEEVHASLEQLIARLEERTLAEEEERAHAWSPSVTSYRRLSETPSLVASGSSASLASLADLAALVTPTGSPRSSSMHITSNKYSTNLARDVVHEKDNAEISEEDMELDFACALAAGSVTRQRRASALSAIFALGSAININSNSNSVLPYAFADPNSPLEDGVNLISIPPTRACELASHPVSEVTEVIAPQQSPEARASSPRATSPATKRGSWLDPFVRRANSDILKAHLANLLEIEQMLFGAEDREREDVPSPGSVVDEEEEGWSWREGVDVFQDDIRGKVCDVKEDDEDGDKGNFLDMFGEDVQKEDEDEEDEDECCSTRAPTVRPANASSERCSSLRNAPRSALAVLKIARRELYAVEEAMLTACRSIETAQRYISQAERLTKDIFQKMERAVQASQHASTLYRIETQQGRSRSRSRCNSILTNGTVNAESQTFPFPPAPLSSRSRRTPESIQSLSSHPPSSSLLYPSSLQSSLSSLSPSPSPESRTLNADADIKWLCHLLVRKIPIWLDATAYDVDKAGVWVGIVRGVVRCV